MPKFIIILAYFIKYLKILTISDLLIDLQSLNPNAVELHCSIVFLHLFDC